MTPRSSNVFADSGFAEPEEELAKAQLASRIQDIVKQRRLTQVAAASLMGIDQPKVSALLNGRLANFSSGRRREQEASSVADTIRIVADPKSSHGPDR